MLCYLTGSKSPSWIQCNYSIVIDDGSLMIYDVSCIMYHVKLKRKYGFAMLLLMMYDVKCKMEVKYRFAICNLP